MMSSSDFKIKSNWTRFVHEIPSSKMTVRQLGQVALVAYQISMHSWWNQCWQLSLQATSPTFKSSRQMEQVNGSEWAVNFWLFKRGCCVNPSRLNIRTIMLQEQVITEIRSTIAKTGSTMRMLKPAVKMKTMSLNWLNWYNNPSWFYSHIAFKSRSYF